MLCGFSASIAFSENIERNGSSAGVKNHIEVNSFAYRFAIYVARREQARLKRIEIYGLLRMVEEGTGEKKCDCDYLLSHNVRRSALRFGLIEELRGRF